MQTLAVESDPTAALAGVRAVLAALGIARGEPDPEGRAPAR
ncbi:hypothetical protein [Streptomyces sp. NPDC048057]